MQEVAHRRESVDLSAARWPVSTVVAHSTDDTSIPLSPAQEQIWLHVQLVPHTPIYNEAVTIRRNGTLDVPALERSFTEIVRRHQAWRTAFRFVDGELAQVIHSPAPVHFPVFNLSNVHFSQREAEALRLAAKAAALPFDLSREALFRGFVAHLSETEHRLFLTLHHIIFDGYSISRVLLPELATLYSAFSTGESTNLPEPPIQYSDFAICERDWLNRDYRAASQLDYWRKQLNGDLQVLQLPTDRARPPIPSFRGATEPIMLDRKLGESLKQLSRREMSSLFMTTLAAFAVLLQRYSSSSSLTIGTVSSRRKRVELEQLLGCFINPLALRIDLAGDPAFLEVLRQTRKATLEALSNDDVPFAQIANEVHANHTLSSHPLFQVLFTMEAPLLKVPKGWDVSLTQPEVDTGMSRFDLSLELDDRPDGICGQFRYSTDLFDRETIVRMKGHFATLLDSIAANPDRRISKLNLLTPTEQQTVQVDWNNTSTDQSSDQVLQQLFKQQTERTPQAVALEVGSASLTYDELDRKTDQLAADLRQRGIRPEQPVGLYLEPSIEMIVGTIGVLKAGGTCVPLDPSYPAERLSYAIADTQLRLLLTQQHLHHQLPSAEVAVLCLDSEENRVEQMSPASLPSDCTPDNLAYVIYTSGSTGKPKGVQITHRNLLHSTRARARYYGPGAARFLLLSSFSFDSSLAGILGTLCHGGTLVMIPGPLKSNLTRISHFIQKHEITRLLCVPTLYSLILEQAEPGQLRTLREAIVGGESCSGELLERHYELVPHANLFNEYGPTEAAVWSTVHKCSPGTHGNVVPVGRPIPNTRVYVLDPNLNLMPIGVAGELCIGGPGVVRGYLNRPEETEKSFVSDPFSDVSGARLYKTGDVARYLPDGNLELLGRFDHQVKIRGFRIELEEVESAICEYEDMRNAAVIVRQLSGTEPMLVAYVVPKDGCKFEVEALRRFLAQKLPEAMVPSRFATLESLPLMPNGKVNRQALSSVAIDVQAVEVVLPRDALESKLVEIWGAVLKKSEIGVTASFFELGGNSLLVAKLLLRLERDFGKRLSLSDIFQSPTIRQLAGLLEERQRPAHPAVIPLQPDGSRTPLYWVDGGPLFLPLARSFDKDQPVLGLRVPVSEAGRFQVPFRIEEGAAELVRYLREIQTKGPYYLAGLCIDGLVAYEMARQLVAQGDEVAVLALLDAPSPSPQQAPLAESSARIPSTKFEMLWTELLQGGINGAPGFVHRRCKGIARRLKLFRWSVQQSLGLKLNINKLLNDPDVIEQPRSYFSKPRLYPGRVLFFQSDDFQSPDTAWYSLISGGWKVHRVSGGHLSMFHEENVGSLADKLRACLSEYQDMEEAPK